MIPLTIELVPSSSWYSNVRTNVSKSDWDKIRLKCYAKAHYKCEICEGDGKKQGFKHSVECHEIWQYNNGEQKLVGFISLCPLCHKAKHIGLAQLNGEYSMVKKHIMKVNNMTSNEVENMVSDAFKVWRERSQQKWNVNIELIYDTKEV